MQVDDDRDFYFDNGVLSALRIRITADYSVVRDDVTSRLGISPTEVTVPYQNAFGAKWNDITAIWDTTQLHVKLSQGSNPSHPTLPSLLVQSRAAYNELVEREKSQPKPLDP
jgi:hypothetical protein